ncbi:MAG: insulinase family protein [Ruminococcus sp.]|nr:insulinase family protein [Ruminococcus sp.]
MAFEMSEERLEKGLLITHIKDDKFSTESIVVRFLLELNEQTAQSFTAMISMLAETNAKYPDKALLARRQAQLYGASLSSISYRMGDTLDVGLSVYGIDDRCTIDGEGVTKDCAQLLLDCIFEPDIKNGNFNESVFESKKRELIDRIKSSADNRQAYAARRARELAFVGEPAAVSLLGTLENAQALTNEQLVESYQKMLDEAFISITFCGSGRNTEAQQLVAERFVKLAGQRDFKGKDLNSLAAPSAHKDKPVTVTESIEQAQSKLFMYYKTKGENLAAEQVACALFGGTPFSKLFTNVREKLSLCYYCQSAMVEAKSAMAVASGVAQGNEKKAADEIVCQLEELKKGNFTDSDLENTKRSIIDSYRTIYDAVDELSSWYFTRFALGDTLSPNDMADIISGVTREQVVEAANGFELDTVFTLLPLEKDGEINE